MNRKKRTIVVLFVSILVASAASYFVYGAVSSIPVREVEVKNYYVAVAAIFTLLALVAYGSRLVEWDAPFVIGTSDQEQRYAVISLVLLALASVVLLGLAWALT